MANSIHTKSPERKPRLIRNLPAWQIIARLRRAGVTQWDIAKAVGRSQTHVSGVINRRLLTGPGIEPTWKEIERVLGNGGRR